MKVNTKIRLLRFISISSYLLAFVILTVDWLAPAYAPPLGMVFAPILLIVGGFSKVFQVSYSRELPERQSDRK